MNYTIFTRDQVAPKYLDAHELGGGTAPRLNPGGRPAYPPTFTALVQRSAGFDIYDPDPAKRQELWIDSAGTATAEEVAPFLALVYAADVERLWAAATAWQDQFISGVAIGLLTIGVLQGKEKALQVQAWSGALWSNYYLRKDAILRGESVSYDFSNAGPMPYSVPELREELGL